MRAFVPKSTFRRPVLVRLLSFGRDFEMEDRFFFFCRSRPMLKYLVVRIVRTASDHVKEETFKDFAPRELPREIVIDKEVE